MGHHPMGSYQCDDRIDLGEMSDERDADRGQDAPTPECHDCGDDAHHAAMTRDASPVPLCRSCCDCADCQEWRLGDGSEDIGFNNDSQESAAMREADAVYARARR